MPMTVAGTWLASLVEPLRDMPWTDWHGLWLGTITSGRNAALYFLPLLLILLALPRRALRTGILLTSLVFVAYVFGLLYLVLWLLTCVVFYALGQRFAAAEAGDRRWPAAAVIGLIAGYFVLVHGLGAIRLPEAWETWMTRDAAWLLPLGARRWAWEPGWLAGLPLLKGLLARTHDIGVAYLAMRLVSYFSELKRGTIRPEQRSLSRFLCWVCYAPTMIQGPIERYREFHAQLDTCYDRRSWAAVGVGLWRIVLGLFKCLVFVSVLDPAMSEWGIPLWRRTVLYETPEKIQSYALLFFAVHIQVLAVYLTFSGYCDIAIGMSRLLGIEVIENFKRPWMARSLTDMWRRWHISLSFILRDYIFFPLTRRRWNPTANLLLTFFVCGIWHNFSAQYAAWGLLMGLLVAVNQRWSRWMRNLDRHPQRFCSRVRRAWLRLQPLPKICAWLLTINVFVMTGWVCLGGNGAARVAWELLRRPLSWLLGGGGT
jgi:D-alanyl-lipoteichoic acid acyltransferase DltB (MBOAT superfamily)